jgi:hypothetical protein
VPEALAPVRTWLDDQRALWEDRLDRLDAYVMTLMQERDPGRRTLIRTPTSALPARLPRQGS